MPKLSGIVVEQGQLSADPSTPTSGFSSVYPKTNGNWYVRNPDGSVFQVAFTDSPVFTGVPEAPTAAPGTSTEQIASTEFVGNEIDAALVDAAPLALTDASTISWNWESGAVAYVTIAGNRSISLTNVPDGQSGILVVTQDGTGGRTLALTGQVEGQIKSGAAEQTVLGFIRRGSTIYWSIDNQIDDVVEAEYGPPDFEFIVSPEEDGDTSFIVTGADDWDARLYRNGIKQPRLNDTGRGTWAKSGSTIALTGSTLVEGELIQLEYYKASQPIQAVVTWQDKSSGVSENGSNGLTLVSGTGFGKVARSIETISFGQSVQAYMGNQDKHSFQKIWGLTDQGIFDGWSKINVGVYIVGPPTKTLCEIVENGILTGIDVAIAQTDYVRIVYGTVFTIQKSSDGITWSTIHVSSVTPGTYYWIGADFNQTGSKLEQIKKNS